MELTIQEVVNAVNGKLIIEGNKNSFNEVCTDTRKIKKNDLFISLKGDNFNGNDYALKAVENGASAVIISEEKFKREQFSKNVNVILVEDGRKALGKLAKYYRDKLKIKVVGVTGSTGKTSTKDLIAAFLSGRYKVFKTEGNFNNDIGLPLMILKLNEKYDIAVLEMGMNNFGEIDYLADISRPDVAVITNVGVAHIEYLKTRENILKEKMSISNYMDKTNVLILNAENDMLNTIKKDYGFKIIKTGYNHNNDLFAENIKLTKDSTEFDIIRGKQRHTFKLNMPGEHNVLNGLVAAAVGIQFNMSFDEMDKGLENFQATSMRLEIIDNNRFVIINDSYNANPDSMKAALRVLGSYDNKRRIAVLGTMGELGTYAEKGHKEIAEYALKNADILFACGEYKKCYEEGFTNNCYTFDNKKQLIDELKSILKENDVVLIKASRSAHFEEIVEELNNIDK